MASLEKLNVEGNTMDVYVDGPASATAGPAVILMYHRGGVDGFTKSVMRRLADSGYHVAVPDVSHRQSADIPMADRKQYLKDAQVVADIHATLAFLRSRDDVDSDSIAIMGHCMGGRMAFLGGAALPGEFRGIISLYGGGVMTPWGDERTTPFALLKNIRCPVIAFFGELDRNPSPQDAQKIAAELCRHGVKHTFHSYAGVGHGFQNPAHREPAERAAAEDSWTKLLAFLATVT